MSGDAGGSWGRQGGEGTVVQDWRGKVRSWTVQEVAIGGVLAYVIGGR